MADNVHNDRVMDEKLETAVKEQMEKLRTQSMLLGFQVACYSVLQKIADTMQKPGKTSMNDYKRLVKDIHEFCATGVSKKVNLDGTTSEIEEDNTKLMEGTDGSILESN